MDTVLIYCAGSALVTVLLVIAYSVGKLKAYLEISEILIQSKTYIKGINE